MGTKEKIQAILSKFSLNNYVSSCKGLTISEFEQYTINVIDEFENDIKSFNIKNGEVLNAYAQELSNIRVFYDKALNYVKTKDAKVHLFDGEQELLDKLYNNVVRNN